MRAIKQEHGNGLLYNTYLVSLLFIGVHGDLIQSLTCGEGSEGREFNQYG